MCVCVCVCVCLFVVCGLNSVCLCVVLSVCAVKPRISRNLNKYY